jgi:lipopolysaccharide transport system ATP-binding protein
MSKIVIKAENISKQYRLGLVGTGTIRDDLKRWYYNVRGKEDPFLKIGEANDRSKKGDSDYVWSLKDINFEINQGDSVGIIGRNGAGKSTLLKILSQVTQPTTGKIYTKGRIASLLEVGTGFHPEMTGRENIYLNGAILGMRKHEITRKLDEIIAFSGVERYIDTPVKRYSSGMYVRLAFAVAAHLESEILIVDEVLAVGDAEFQKKCLGKMGEVSKGEGRTVLFVSHDLNAVSQICNTGILLNNGLVEYTGKIRKTVSAYLSADNDEVIYSNNKDNSRKQIYIKQIEVVNSDGIVSKEYSYDETINFKFNICLNENISKCSFFVTILDSKKRRVFSCERQSVNDLMTLTIDPKTLVRGKYSIHAFINQPKIAQLDVVEDVCKFIVTDSNSYLSKHGEYDYGCVFGRYSWK